MVNNQLITEILDLYNTEICKLLSNVKSLNPYIFIFNIHMGDLKIQLSTLQKNWKYIIKSSSNTQLEEILNILDNYYYNGESIVSDDVYDKILEHFIKTTKQPRNKFGHTNISVQGAKVKLPIHMGSMSKAKPGSTELTSFFTNYTNDKCIMDKLDGTSLLCDFNNPVFPKAYTRGNGTVGHDVSHLMKYIKGIKNNKQYTIGGYVRGELIVSKEDWEKIVYALRQFIIP